jgi:hypothetical protein
MPGVRPDSRANLSDLSASTNHPQLIKKNVSGSLPERGEITWRVLLQM